MTAMVISLAGEWDIYRRKELGVLLESAMAEPRIILDLTGAKYVSSTLIGALIVTHKERMARELPPMVLAVKSAFVRRLLAATGLEALFTIYESVEEAPAHNALSA